MIERANLLDSTHETDPPAPMRGRTMAAVSAVSPEGVTA